MSGEDLPLNILALISRLFAICIFPSSHSPTDSTPQVYHPHRRSLHPLPFLLQVNQTHIEPKTQKQKHQKNSPATAFSSQHLSPLKFSSPNITSRHKGDNNYAVLPQSVQANRSLICMDSFAPLCIEVALRNDLIIAKFVADKSYKLKPVNLLAWE